jgi:hypothetical protein
MSTQVRSSSWKSWEWIGGASLLALAGALILFSKRLSLSYQVGLWGVWIAVLALLFRQGWIRLFGPVLLYDMVRTGRRTRNILLRCIYALALFLMVYLVYSEYTSKIQDLLRNQSYLKRIYPYEVATLNQLMAKEMAKFAESFFLMFMEVQFIGVFLLTPAYAAGAIAEEGDCPGQAGVTIAWSGVVGPYRVANSQPDSILGRHRSGLGFERLCGHRLNYA